MNDTASPLKLRRKPVQQRSRMTQQAILDAFVRLLVEKGYADLTMRDIALVAGVGLGTLYEYFPGKKSIAAHCIHERFKSIGTQMQVWVASQRGKPLQVIIAYLIEQIIHMHAEKTDEWSALIFLERQISNLEAYASLYGQIVDIWELAFQASDDRQNYPGKSPAVVHAAVYGVLYQTLMLSPQSLLEAEFLAQMKNLVLGYLQIADLSVRIR
ncbi:TetR/AcrR family transcriptional regulator [Undibacterium sp. TS12]|uniref:TetR/AcrR family transcriptional regulator n=1 Tax=Undibacterium sp. TS12 TaxID=2908202 RepID=UPI001F4C7862|nr:TetR/AcrR family transcriptional regulator [Undibacterium sp. TS12]MCH8618869.1 TetR/AcrR family transcriptional regulator [Undibacterium sp. TS12]